ncbi:MAG: DUF6495 family protein [Lutibacter sp.]
MKYIRLTKEQLTNLHEEFAKFLATQKIDAKKWETLKKENSKLVEEELDLFSDLVWEKSLSNVKFIDHISEKYLNLFQCNSKEMVRIVVNLNHPTKSFLNDKDFNWFLNHLNHSSIEYFKGTKKYTEDRNKELYKLIEKGGQISDGKLFKNLIQLIN